MSGFWPPFRLDPGGIRLRRIVSGCRAQKTRAVRCSGRCPGPPPGGNPLRPPPPFPAPPCSRTVLAVQGALQKIFSNPEKIFFRRAKNARPGRLRAVPKILLRPGKGGKCKVKTSLRPSPSPAYPWSAPNSESERRPATGRFAPAFRLILR